MKNLVMEMKILKDLVLEYTVAMFWQLVMVYLLSINIKMN